MKISLGSSKSTQKSIFQQQHITNDLKSFFMKNNMNVFLSDCLATLEYSENFKYQNFSFEIETKSPYYSLNNYLFYTNHNENEVITNQYTCHSNIALKEFQKFGFFRAGHRLQLRNLLDALVTRTLSLNKIEIYYLFSQSLYQVGPFLAENSFESHVDFSNPEYNKNLINSLSYLCDFQNNWTDNLALLNIVIIALRALSLIDDVENKKLVIEILKKSRKYGENWQKKINEIINDRKKSQKNSESFKNKLVEIATTTILTFIIETENRPLVISKQEDLIVWLSSFNNLINNIPRNNLNDNFFIRHLYNMAIFTSNELEDFLLTEFKKKNFKALNRYVRSIWSEAKEGNLSNWMIYEKPIDKWFFCEFTPDSEGGKPIVLQLNFYGKLLIHGKSFGLLPTSMIKHEEYLRLFGATTFNVFQTYESETTFVTKEDKNLTSFRKINYFDKDFEQSLYLYWI